MTFDYHLFDDAVLTISSAHTDWNEARTCGALVEPMLQNIGWGKMDPAPHQWVPQVHSGSGRADGVLYTRHVADMTVEIKVFRPVQNISQDASCVAQAVRYAVAHKARWAALTDGRWFYVYDVWRLRSQGALTSGKALPDLTLDLQYYPHHRFILSPSNIRETLPGVVERIQKGESCIDLLESLYPNPNLTYSNTPLVTYPLTALLYNHTAAYQSVRMPDGVEYDVSEHQKRFHLAIFAHLLDRNTVPPRTSLRIHSDGRLCFSNEGRLYGSREGTLKVVSTEVREGQHVLTKTNRRQRNEAAWEVCRYFGVQPPLATLIRHRPGVKHFREDPDEGSLLETPVRQGYYTSRGGVTVVVPSGRSGS